MRKPKHSSSKTYKSGRSAAKRIPSRRKALVFLSLVTVLSVTSLLLRAMAPLPMQPDAYSTLIGFAGSDLHDALFANLQTPVQEGRWQYVYIHHSKTLGGNALSLGRTPSGVGDHFVIGNGDGLADGELQISQRWNHQQSAESPTSDFGVDPACISICIVGDLDQTPPTSLQLGRLGQLVQTLQMRCRVPSSQVQWLQNGQPSVAGIGCNFPADVFQKQLRSTANLDLAATPTGAQ